VNISPTEYAKLGDTSAFEIADHPTRSTSAAMSRSYDKEIRNTLTGTAR
jgi:hypothetical protein